MCVSQNLELVVALEVCKQCKSKKTYMKDQMTTHPVWINKEGVPQYLVPKELQNLREAEKLLIYLWFLITFRSNIYTKVNWGAMVMYVVSVKKLVKYVQGYQKDAR